MKILNLKILVWSALLLSSIGFLFPHIVFAVTPDVATAPAKSITFESALLDGAANLHDPKGGFVWFKYGESKENVDDNETPKQSSQGGAFSYKITGLKPDTKYFFQACAKNSESNSDVCDNVLPNILEFTTSKKTAADINPGENIDPSKDYELLAPLPGLDAIKENTTLAGYLSTIFKVAIGLTTFLAVVYLIIGGIQYATTEALSGKGEGRTHMTNAILGLVLALSAYLILNTLNPDLVNLNFLLRSVSIESIEEDVDDAGNIIKFSTPLPGDACPSKEGKDTCQKLLVSYRSSGDSTEKTLNIKLSQLGLALKNKESIGEMWAVTEAWRPSRQHKAKCHQNGTCVDANFNFTPDSSDVKYFIEASKDIGLCAIYEVKSDGSRQDFINGGVDPKYIANFGSWISAPHFSIYGSTCK